MRYQHIDMRYPTMSPYELEHHKWNVIFNTVDGFYYDIDCMCVMFAKDIDTGVVFYPKIVMEGKIEPDTEWYVDSIPIVNRKLVGHKRPVAMVPR